MLYWIRLDEELIGALDESGCYADPVSVDHVLSEYGIEDFEERRAARRLLRALGSGRADAIREAFGEEPEGDADKGGRKRKT